MNYTDKQIEDLLDGIYSGKITERKLSKSLYKAIGEYLEKGLYKGFGMTLSDADGKDLELLTALRENVFMFAAAKTYQQTKDISSLLVDASGNVRSRDEFNAAGRKAYDNWNNNYGKAEYNTAVGQGQMAVKWSEIESNKEFLPMLRYKAVGGETTCPICGALDDLVAPVTDPIWKRVSPINHFNCMCIVLQEDDSVKSTHNYQQVASDAEDKMSKVFIGNPYFDETVFNKHHPYFKDVPAKDKNFAKRNFDLPLP